MAPGMIVVALLLALTFTTIGLSWLLPWPGVHP